LFRPLPRGQATFFVRTKKVAKENRPADDAGATPPAPRLSQGHVPAPRSKLALLAPRCSRPRGRAYSASLRWSPGLRLPWLVLLRRLFPAARCALGVIQRVKENQAGTGEFFNPLGGRRALERASQAEGRRQEGGAFTLGSRDVPCVKLRRERSAQRSPLRAGILGAPFLFAPFLWASKEKGPVCAAESALLNKSIAADGGTRQGCRLFLINSGA
jgi:hypothetical protein